MALSWSVARTVGYLVPGLLLAAAGIAKLAHLRWFAARVDDYRLLPRKVVPLAATAIAVSEVMAGCLVSAQIAPTVSTWAAVVLLCLFTAVMGLAMARAGRPRSCGCSAAHDMPVGWNGILRNAGLIAMLIGAEAGRGSLSATSFALVIGGSVLATSAVVLGSRPSSAGDDQNGMAAA